MATTGVPQCEHCHEVFTEQRSLVRHQRARTCREDAKKSKQTSPCPHCGRGFSRAAGVARHLKERQCRARSRREVDSHPGAELTAKRPGSLTLMAEAPDSKRSQPVHDGDKSNDDIASLPSAAGPAGNGNAIFEQTFEPHEHPTVLEEEHAMTTDDLELSEPFHDADSAEGATRSTFDPVVTLDMVLESVPLLQSSVQLAPPAMLSMAASAAPSQPSTLSSSAREILASIPEHDDVDSSAPVVAEVATITPVPLVDPPHVDTLMANEKRLRRRTMWFSETSLEVDMERLSVDTYSTRVSECSLFGNPSRASAGRDSTRSSAAGGVRSLIPSTNSWQSEGMPAPFASKMDEELELGRREFPVVKSDPADELWVPRIATDLLTPENTRRMCSVVLRLESSGSSPLITAVRAGDAETVRRFVSSQVVSETLEKCDQTGRDALMHAAAAASDEIVDLLLSRWVFGARSPVDRDGNTAFMLAANAEPDSQASLVLERLMRGLQIGPRIFPSGLLKVGSNAAGSSSLHIAVQKGNIEVVRCFLRWKGLTSEVLDFRGRTVYHIAAEQGNEQMMELLLESKRLRADGVVNVRCHSGETALMIAVRRGYLAIVNALASHRTCDIWTKHSYTDITAVEMADHLAATDASITALAIHAELQMRVKDAKELPPSLSLCLARTFGSIY